jgi:hypothetical protein
MAIKSLMMIYVIPTVQPSMVALGVIILSRLFAIIQRILVIQNVNHIVRNSRINAKLVYIATVPQVIGPLRMICVLTIVLVQGKTGVVILKQHIVTIQPILQRLLVRPGARKIWANVMMV